MLKNEQFREDLYHRINVIPIELPPLRERIDDIPLLVHHFKSKFGEQDCRIDLDVFDALKSYEWPGNVRELENVLQRSLLMRKQPELLATEDLPDYIRNKTKQRTEFRFQIPDDGIDLEGVEKELLLYSLRKHGWNQTQAAKFLSITRQTLLYRMEKYGLKAEKVEEGKQAKE